MSPEKPSTRRQFLKTCARCAGAVGVAGAGWGLILNRADADKVWQIDVDKCATCRDYLNADGLAKCATDCVLKGSAVRAVNDFTACGYCYICPAYYDTNSKRLPDGTYEGLICPEDAIIRKPVGDFDEYDLLNNFYEYTIDETKCNGCGKCVEACRPPMGNGSLRLEVRHNLCRDCNQCSIATVCPYEAFERTKVTGEKPGYNPPLNKHEQE